MANISGFAMWEFTAKENLNSRGQIFLLNLKPQAFGLKISTFPHLLAVSVSQILLHLLWPDGWHVTCCV